MPDLDMRPERREAVAAQLMGVLDGAVVGSSARLRGSLAAGTTGPFSDIDLLWVVPDSAFPAAVSGLEKALGRVRPVLPLRKQGVRGRLPALARRPTPSSSASSATNACVLPSPASPNRACGY